MILALALALSGLAGVSLGLLGGGGSILTTPILLYVLHLEPRRAIATSLVVVGVTSAAAMIQHARSGNVDWSTGLLFGGASMFGAYGGGALAGLVPADLLVALFAAMMAVTAIAMFRGRRTTDAGTVRRPWRLGLDGLLVGGLAGLVGAGGGFVIVPALTLFGGLPIRRAIGTSLFVISIQSFAGFAGHLSHERIDPSLTGMVTLAAVLGSIVGGRLSCWVAPEQLRRAFACAVFVLAALILVGELGGA